MSEDDGIVLNIGSNENPNSTGSNSVTRVFKVLKKGNWKTRRLRAKKILHHKEQADSGTIQRVHTDHSPKKTSSSTGSSLVETSPIHRNVKRQKTSHDGFGNSTSVKPGRKPVTISSLFTSNPTTPILFGDGARDEPNNETGLKALPSNGITASTSAISFEELGLDPMLWMGY